MRNAFFGKIIAKHLATPLHGFSEVKWMKDMIYTHFHARQMANTLLHLSF